MLSPEERAEKVYLDVRDKEKVMVPDDALSYISAAIRDAVADALEEKAKAVCLELRRTLDPPYRLPCEQASEKTAPAE